MNSKVNERRGRALTFMLSMGMLAGVLIWAKLRLVTDIPRSALAVPEELDTGFVVDEVVESEVLIESGEDQIGLHGGDGLEVESEKDD